MHISDLISEKDQEGKVRVSLGRVSFWFMFVAIMKQAWVIGTIDSSLIYFAATLLVYSGYKKWPEVKGIIGK